MFPYNDDLIAILFFIIVQEFRIINLQENAALPKKYLVCRADAESSIECLLNNSHSIASINLLWTKIKHHN